jgi:hypothetical protein
MPKHVSSKHSKEGNITNDNNEYAIDEDGDCPHGKPVLYCSVFCGAKHFHPFIFVIFHASFFCNSFFDGMKERHSKMNG